MHAPLTLLLTSAAAVCALGALFQYERTNRVRFARSVRTRIDRILEDAAFRARRTYHRVTGQTIRQSIHYIFHRILTVLLRALQRLEDSVRAIVRRNKNRANRSKTALKSSLSALAHYKRNTRLSDTETKQKRDEIRMGR